MKHSLILTSSLLLALFTGCATTPTAPEKDPNPFADYGPAMKSTAEDPLAAEWQRENAAALGAALSPEAVKALVPATAAEADALLAQVKEAYRSDATALTKIAAVSQMTMCPKWERAPAARAIWTAALLRNAARAPDAYRALFCLDQLRWCGAREQAADVRRIGAQSDDRNVAAFAGFVARELEGRAVGLAR